MKFYLIALISFFLALTAKSETYVYVNTDVIDIPMRSENQITPGVNNLLKRLPSGTKLELISTDSGWTQVKLDNMTGWIVSRYLSSNKPAELRIQEIEDNYRKRIQILESKIQELEDSPTKLFKSDDSNNVYGFTAIDEITLAQLYLGEDTDIEKDLDKSFQLLLSAANKGNAMAQSNLGVYYIRGYGTDINYKEAYKWFLKAAKQKNRKAQYNIAEQYEEGNPDLEVNKRKAFYWYKKASKQGLKEAQYKLAYFYIDGDIVKQDHEKAFSLNLKSALQGYDKAQYSLGIMFENGIGTVKDFERAAHWYGKAADQGHKKAEKQLNELNKGKGSNKSSGAGSGFVVSKNGYIATNYHVIDSCNRILVDGLEAVVVDNDKENDLAILSVNKYYDTVAPLSYKSVELGDNVKVFGYPLSYIFSNEFISLTKGSISSLSGFNNNQSEFRFTASIQPGNSGGPIVGEDGKVVGLVTALLGRKAAELYEFLPQNVNFGVQVSLLLDMMKLNKIPVNDRFIDKGFIVKHYKKATKYIKCYE